MIGAAIILIAGMFLFLQRARFGRALRALPGNELAAKLVGIDVPRTTTIGFMVGCALGTLTGALVGPLLLLFPMMGASITIKGFIIIILGGFGSFGGAMLAAYILGIVESLFSGYAFMEWTSAVGYLGLVAVLYLRPKGMFGKD
ncbi:High-affinity branched-chain amino acid transport system permease protein LivH [subsurface metagenome]